MAATTFEPGHQDMVHDCQFDYYGRRLATCSSDRSIKVFELSGEQRTQIADLRGHEGPVWQVSWAHPRFGALLASCSFDHRVIVWKEGPDGSWQQIYKTPSSLHTASINGVAWAPQELGLLFATAASDGSVGVVEYAGDGNWQATTIPSTHALGCTAVSWAPAAAAGQPVRRLVSAGCDNTAKVWRCGSDGSWQQEAALSGHTDWVRDAAWAPSLGLPGGCIATAGQDGQVLAWAERADGSGWDRAVVHAFKVPVWRVSWSVTGGILAVSDGSNAVSLWKESLDGTWQQLEQ